MPNTETCFIYFTYLFFSTPKNAGGAEPWEKNGARTQKPNIYRGANNLGSPRSNKHVPTSPSLCTDDCLAIGNPDSFQNALILLAPFKINETIIVLSGYKAAMMCINTSMSAINSANSCSSHSLMFHCIISFHADSPICLICFQQ